MKKKITILLLCFIVLLAFISCNKGNEEVVNDQTANQEVATTTETKEVQEPSEPEVKDTQDTTSALVDDNNLSLDVVEGEDTTLAEENNEQKGQELESEKPMEKVYNFTFMDAKIKATLNNGKAIINYPNNFVSDEIANGLSYIELILDLNPSDFTYSFNNPGELVLTYPSFISDEELIEGFKIGLEYYLPYANYDKFNFDLYGRPVYLGIKDGNAIVIYPKDFDKDEVSSLLDMMLNSPEAAGFGYTILEDRVVSITYPSILEEDELINGFVALLNKTIVEYLGTSEKVTKPAMKENVIPMPVKTGSSYDFILMGENVKATLNDGEATVKYPEIVSNEEVEKGLEFIGKELNLNASDYTYNFVNVGEVILTYPTSLTDEEVIEGFTSGLNLYLKSMTKTETVVAVKEPVTDVKAIEIQAKVPVVELKPTKVPDKEEFIKNYENFEFYLGDVHVEGMVSEKDVVFKYESEFFDNNLEKELLKIASTMTSYKASDFTYAVDDGQLTFTYSDDINPNEAIDAFFNVIFSL